MSKPESYQCDQCENEWPAGDCEHGNQSGRWMGVCPQCRSDMNPKDFYYAMKDKDETPKVGVGIIVKKHDAVMNECILLGLRKGSHGAGKWSLPGGHMKVGEGFWGVCSRELREETGLHVTSLKHAGFTNDDMVEEGLHYITLYFEVTWQPGQHGKEPVVMEPDKCEEWRWWNMKHLPNNLWEPIKRLVTEGGLEGARITE